MDRNKYILNHGCHKGTAMSRDTASPEYFDTEEDAIVSYQGHRSFYRSIGYQIWFAEIISPDGSKRILEQNPY